MLDFFFIYLTFSFIDFWNYNQIHMRPCVCLWRIRYLCQNTCVWRLRIYFIACLLFMLTHKIIYSARMKDGVHGVLLHHKYALFKSSLCLISSIIIWYMFWYSPCNTPHMPLQDCKWTTTCDFCNCSRGDWWCSCL